MKNKADIAVAGLAVMGENLVLNMESKGFAVAVYNRTGSRTDDFMNGRGKGRNIIPAHSVAELCASLKRPRRIMLMVKAGAPVDALIGQLVPELENGDIIIDVYLMVRYGYAIPETARKVQDSVSAAVSGMTGYSVQAVNVHVGGISFN